MAARACRSAEARSAAYQAKPESAVCAAPTATTSPRSAAQLDAPAPGPRSRRRSRSVRYRSDGQGLEQGGAGGRVVAHVAQRGLVERDGLPVRPGAGRLGRRGGRVPQDPGDVAGGRRVVGEHARVRADRLERVDHRRVQRRLGTGHGRAEDRGPGDLVAERDGPAVPVDQAGGGEHTDGRRRHAERVEQFGADRFGGAGEQLEAAAHRRGQPGGPGEHGVPHARGHRGVRLGEDLAEEERVARGPAVDVGRVEPVPVDERGDGRPAQRGQLQRGTRPARRPGRRGPGSADGRPPPRRGRTAPAAGAAPRSGGRGTGRGRASPRRPSAGPPPRTRAGGNAGRRAPPRRSRAGRAVPRSSAGTDGPSSSATSRSGPSGRGVLSESHMPQSGGDPARSTKARSRTVLPMPASPATRTTEPWPAAARRARSSSTSRGCSRSSSRTPTIVESDNPRCPIR